MCVSARDPRLPSEATHLCWELIGLQAVTQCDRQPTDSPTCNMDVNGVNILWTERHFNLLRVQINKLIGVEQNNVFVCKTVSLPINKKLFVPQAGHKTLIGGQKDILWIGFGWTVAAQHHPVVCICAVNMFTFSVWKILKVLMEVVTSDDPQLNVNKIQYLSLLPGVEV